MTSMHHPTQTHPHLGCILLVLRNEGLFFFLSQVFSGSAGCGCPPLPRSHQARQPPQGFTGERDRQRKRAREGERDNRLRARAATSPASERPHRYTSERRDTVDWSGRVCTKIWLNSGAKVPGNGVLSQLLPQGLHLYVCRDRIRQYVLERAGNKLNINGRACLFILLNVCTWQLPLLRHNSVE